MEVLKVFFFAMILISTSSGAETIESSEERISLKSVITELPRTGLEGLKLSFSKESVPYWGMILSSTALLYHYDEVLLDGVQRDGRRLNLGNDDRTKTAFQVGPWDVRFPSDLGSSLYFLGDGITHFAIAGSLIGYGHYAESTKAYNTGLQIVHGMTISTVFSQALKRSFGRESPVKSTSERGAWRPFPSVAEYAKNTAKYDAMPSGHVMTATLTFTVLMENYPEQSYWLLPAEVTWVGLLGWQMVNNGVHWASDYPLGIAMGYVFGKASAQLGKPKKEKEADSAEWMILPSIEQETLVTNLMIQF